jgi:hypothetical protein
MSTFSAPRRGRKTVQGDGQQIITWDNGSTTVLAASSGLGFDDPLTRQLTAATRSFNLFRKPLLVSDHDTIRLGKLKTRAFMIALPLASIAILTWYHLTPQLQNVTKAFPTYAQFTEMASFGPTCPCTQTDLNLGDVAALHISTLANTSLNMCSAVNAIVQNMNQSFINSDVGTLVNAYVGQMGGLCDYLRVGIGHLQENFNNNPLGAELQSPGTFLQSATFVALGEVQKYLLLVHSIEITLQTNWDDMTVSFLDASFGSSVRNPVNCSCALPTGNQPSTVVWQGGRCTFQIAFDTRPLSSYWATNWTCIASRNLAFFPMELFENSEFLSLVGLSTPVPFQTNAQAFIDALRASMYSFYTDGANMTVLNTSLITANFETYFDACKPSQCSYDFKGIPPLVTALSLSIGTSLSLPCPSRCCNNSSCSC